MRIGSLFSGAGGLDTAVQAVFGGETVWHCENDLAASKVLSARWPSVPNLGDITTIGKHPKVGWDYIEPVDILEEHDKAMGRLLEQFFDEVFAGSASLDALRRMIGGEAA